MSIKTRALFLCAFMALYFFTTVTAQESDRPPNNEIAVETAVPNLPKPILVSVLPKYYSPQDGISVQELIERGLRSNQELAATRLEIEKAKARLLQAGLRPNPTLDLEGMSGAAVGNSGDRNFSIGANLPIEIYGKRQSRVNYAKLEVELSEAVVRNKERLLGANILMIYAQTLGALREIESLEKILELQLQTTKYVQINVNEGETAPLELNLLQAEVERLRSRREIAEGKLNSFLTQIKLLAGIPFEEALRIREQISDAGLPTIPKEQETAIESALRNRPDIFLIKAEENLANAGLQLVQANSKPTLNAYLKYSQGSSNVDLPNGVFPQKDRSLTFGVVIGIPSFNRNQGAKAEAEIFIKQTRERREFAEKVVRSEVLAAYQLYNSTNRAVLTLESSAIPRSMSNVNVFRQVYEIGEIKITDLIAEQRRFLDVNRDLTDALVEKYRAQAELHVALGADFLSKTKQGGQNER